MSQATSSRSPWAWIPSLYFAEGLPYVLVMTLSVIMYKRLGISNTELALYTSWLYLPWVIKPFWSPFVDMFKTKRFWTVIMQIVIGGGLAGIALTIPTNSFFQLTLAFFWLMAFSSATHDIAADGFYMIPLREDQQAFFVGIRSTFYRVAMITGQGLIVVLAGYLESTTGMPPVELHVSASPEASIHQLWYPDTLVLVPADSVGIYSQPETLNLSTQNMLAKEADSLITFAQEWNERHHFFVSETATDAQGEPQVPSWWTRKISEPLGSWLKENVGPDPIEKDSLAKVGRLGLVAFRLSQPLLDNQSLVLNLSYFEGDKNFSIKGPSRFSFTSTNWEQPVFAIIQIDPKLQKASSASFRAVSGNFKLAWSITFLVLAAMMVLLGLYHKFALPRPEGDKPATEGSGSAIVKAFLDTFGSFFQKPGIGLIIAFLLLYRLGESQLVKLAAPFLLDSSQVGGLGLTTGEVGIIYGTIGLLSLTIGGILGGILASKHGLKKWFWWMLLAMNLPNMVYIFLAYFTPESYLTIASCVAVEQFGYGFGFTAFMMYMIYMAEGKHKTAHFAIGTGFMALGMMIPGMISGWLQEAIGYQHFFIWVMVATIPSFVISYFVPMDAEFGKKKK